MRAARTSRICRLDSAEEGRGEEEVVVVVEEGEDLVWWALSARRRRRATFRWRGVR